MNAQLIGHAVTMAAHFAVQHTERRKTEVAASMHQVQQAAASEKDQAQAALLMKLASAAENLQNRKMDLVVETFRETHKLISDHHAALLEERRELNSRRFEGTEEQQLRDSLRRGEIGLELIDLAKASAVVAMQANRMAQQIGSTIRLPTTPLLV